MSKFCASNPHKLLSWELTANTLSVFNPSRSNCNQGVGETCLFFYYEHTPTSPLSATVAFVGVVAKFSKRNRKLARLPEGSEHTYSICAEGVENILGTLSQRLPLWIFESMRRIILLLREIGWFQRWQYWSKNWLIEGMKREFFMILGNYGKYLDGVVWKFRLS